MTDTGSTDGTIKVVTVMERIDAYNAGELEKLFSDALSGGAQKLVCDLKNNEYISSAGLRVFLVSLKSVKRSGGEIALCALRPSVKNIFDMAGFTRLFKVFDTCEEAVTALQ